MKTTTTDTTMTTTTTTNNKSVRSRYLANYLRSVKQANELTAVQYEYRLSKFEKYVVTASEEELQKRQQQQNQELLTLDHVINELKNKGDNNNKIDPYDILSGFVAYLEEEGIENPNTLRYFVATARNFLEYNDVEISPRKFKLKVRLPKAVIRHKEAISKEDIREILLKCSNIKLKTYLMLLASTGMRATEALTLRHKDFDFDDENSNNNNHQAFVRIRGESTKTRIDRYVFLTKEMVGQCKAWTDYKYRRRRLTKVVNNTPTRSNNVGGKAVSYWIEPELSPDDLFFSMPRKRKRSSLRGLYVHMNDDFAKTLDRIGFGDREDGNERRRAITFHSFRRFVKTTISDLGYQDFSEWFIGHAGSTYWRKKDSEKAELFRKIEPYLTFLDITGLESKGADMETKTEQVIAENLSLKQQVDELYRVLYAQGIIKKELSFSSSLPSS